ncbi:MAG TPA: flagellar hook protein FlgE [Vicinamibacterales bacterium]|jgi:flagellar hook protein FlgE|nr:flagellar hook protein FlgE [Vicinamibacterales bacterium]
MSVGSFSAALSGLDANQQKLSVIGNNLANLNTVAYKASTVNFDDLVSQSIGGSSDNPMQIGLGVTVGSITPNFTQGNIENTGVPTDVAIQGQGFFLVGDADNRSYTRAGNFSFDPNGVLVTSDGQPVQGYTAVDPATGGIDTSGQPSDIVIPPGVLRQPTPTTSFGTFTNLDASAPTGTTHASSVQIYDSLGVSHIETVTMTKTATNGKWDYSITVPGEDVSGGTAGTPKEIAKGTLEFNGVGTLTKVDGNDAADVSITSPTWANGATAANLSWDLVDANGTPTITNYAAPSATSSTVQNGAPTGSVSSVISINASGELVASFGMGQSVTVGQLATATFNNPAGMIKLGTNLYSQSEASGIPSVGTPGTGGRGPLIGSALEQSNVDIANEFTQMILAQRGYQANSKSITVADELLVDTLDLLR